jgi:hypothetical protein
MKIGNEQILLKKKLAELERLRLEIQERLSEPLESKSMSARVG